MIAAPNLAPCVQRKGKDKQVAQSEKLVNR